VSDLSQPDVSDVEDLFENGAMAIHLVGGDGTILRANRAELDLLGYAPDEYIGHNISEFHADSETIQDILARLKRGENLNRYPARLRSKDGSIRHVEITSNVRFEDGRFLNTRCFTQDVSELKRTQAQLLAKEKHLENLLNALPAAVYTTDAAGKVTYFNDAAVKLAGRPPEIGEDDWCVSWRLRNEDGTPLPLDQCPMAVALREDRLVRDVWGYAKRPDGTLVPFLPHPTPLHDEYGALIGGINILVDITEQKEREKHIEFVMRELSHRSKNLLAVVVAMASRSIRNATDLDDFETKFMNRLHAMSRSHELLVKNSWSGADIRQIVESEIVAFLGVEREGRARLTGDSILLNPSVAQSLSLAVHELATNATKYGAFSRDGGSVEVEWTPEADNGVLFRWRERTASGAEHPQKKGFGTQVLGALFKEPRFQFTPSGLEFSGLLPHARPYEV
jgi:PAS domain S-box-containing protein